MEGQSESRNQFTVNGSAIQDMELREEWQDEEFPRPLPEDPHSPLEDQENPPTDRPAPPTSLALSGTAKKRLTAAPALSSMLNSDSPVHSVAGLSDTPPDTPSLDINLDALDTPSDSQSYSFPDITHDLEYWEDDLPRLGRGGAGGGASDEEEEEDAERAERGGGGAGGVELEEQFDQVDSSGQRWRRFCISGQEYHVNMTVLQPYLQVLSHGGYYGDNMTAIILVSSCFLPENSVEQYDYVMDNLFRYIVGTLDLMVSEDYVLVYLCGMAPRNKMPAIKWLRQCYTSIDRRLKKDLKGLFVVHPAWYIKALIMLVKPFISEKFSRKLCFVRSLRELSEMLPLDHLQIPECIRQFDEEQNR